MKSYPVTENHAGSVTVFELLRYRETSCYFIIRIVSSYCMENVIYSAALKKNLFCEKTSTNKNLFLNLKVL